MTPWLQAEGLTWATPHGRTGLAPVSLTLGRGERVALVGPSGAGKSTLLRLLVALLPPRAGTLRFEGSPVGPEQVLALRRAVRWVPQRPVGVAATVGADLALAQEAAESGLSMEAQRDLLERMGLGAIPDDQPFARLSGGEQQRVALVRALTGHPKVLLLDEPTAALDAAHRAGTEALLLDWQRAQPERAWIWVSHDAEQLRRVTHRVITLEAP